jgi:hypothetical protein
MKMNKGGNQQNENFLEMGSVPTCYFLGRNSRNDHGYQFHPIIFGSKRKRNLYSLLDITNFPGGFNV